MGKHRRFSHFLGSLNVSEIESSRVVTPAHLYEFQLEKDEAEAQTLLGRTRKAFFVSSDAEAMTNSVTEFVVGPREKVIVRVFTQESLGIKNWMETDFFSQRGFEHVKKFGLIPCLSDDAFGIRTKHSKQKLDEVVLVAHPQISVNGYHFVFSVGHNSAHRRYVYGNFLSNPHKLNGGDLVALRVASPRMQYRRPLISSAFAPSSFA